MKIASLIFIILVFLIALRYTEIFILETKILVGVFVVWFVCLYIQIHLKNKERNIPRPVYMTE